MSDPSAARPVSAGTKGERTRQRILEAARRRLAQVGYDRATIRSIAEEADVDKSSIIQYFGTKQQLFREAVDWDVDMAALNTDDPRRTAENYLRAMLGEWESDPDGAMVALARTAMTSEEAAQILRQKVTAATIDQTVAPNGPDPDARLRLAVAGALMFGIAAQRHLLKMPDLAEADLDELIRLATPLVEQLIR
ncbi:TetR/AcrR family transcriptional regulator [Nocardia cyriacigeorgica]|uniref:TetR/AcrR family transcriptional regulator n=1 Tax=Nocardia cyriacigeorgica TaxID=135487 RepID=UPI00245502D8|nr:TetR family transcriptional regulator [Nocardia cyriacigeorgica]